MALHQSDIENLQKGAINFLYIFIDPNAKGLSKDIMNKRNAQINELSKIYQYQSDYTLQQLVQIVDSSIRARYGKTPAQLLQNIYNQAVIPVAIGSTIPTPDISPGSNIESIMSEAAQRVQNIDVTVPNVGKTNFWADLLNVLQWLITLLNRLFGTYTNPSVYAPGVNDWTYQNAPRSTGSKASFTLLPLVAAGSILYYLSKKKK